MIGSMEGTKVFSVATTLAVSSDEGVVASGNFSCE